MIKDFAIKAIKLKSRQDLPITKGDFAMKTIRTIILVFVAFALVVVAVAMGVFFGNRTTTVLGATATDPNPLCSTIYASPDLALTPRGEFMTFCDGMFKTLTAAPVDVELIRRRVLCSTVEVLATTNPRPYNTCMGTKTP